MDNLSDSSMVEENLCTEERVTVEEASIECTAALRNLSMDDDEEKEDGCMDGFYLYLSIANAEKLDDISTNEYIVKFDSGEFGAGTKCPGGATKLMEKYKELNLELHEALLMIEINDDERGDRASLANELIVDALSMSVKVLHVEISSSGEMLVLPDDVFESNSLTELCVKNCIINQPVGRSGVFPPLLKLKLRSVNIGDDAISDILSGCPMIENMYLRDNCKGLKKISLGKMHNLKSFWVEHVEGGCYVEFFEQGLTQFPNLSSLYLEKVQLEKSIFHDFADKFPCLTSLNVEDCSGYEEPIEISSPSLENINVDDRWSKTVFNVPSIHTFEFWAEADVPSLRINTSSKDWASSSIVLWCSKDLTRSWFLELQKFLQELSVSKEVTLNIGFDYCAKSSRIDKLLQEDISGVPCIPVENLMFTALLGTHSVSQQDISNLLRGLFSVCRPNCVSLLEVPQQEPRRVPLLELLHEYVTEHAGWKGDLKQVSFELLSGEESRPIVWDDLISLLSLKSDDDLEIRLNLEWV